MTSVWITSSAFQGIKDVRTPRARHCEGRTYFLSNIVRGRKVDTQKATGKGVLTNWRAQIGRQVRTRNKCERARGTHVLESPDAETSQDTERMRASEGHSRPGEPRHRDKSEHGNNASQRGALTSWRAQTQRQVRTRKQCEPARGTHALESPDTETSQDTETMRASEGHSPTEEPRHRDKSGHENNVNQRGALTN
jgi:hypothetical protein